MICASNLAFVLAPEEAVDTPSVVLMELLQLRSMTAAATQNLLDARSSKRRRTLVCFKDNHSDVFQPFRVY